MKTRRLHVEGTRDVCVDSVLYAGHLMQYERRLLVGPPTPCGIVWRSCQWPSRPRRLGWHAHAPTIHGTGTASTPPLHANTAAVPKRTNDRQVAVKEFQSSVTSPTGDARECSGSQPSMSRPDSSTELAPPSRQPAVRERCGLCLHHESFRRRGKMSISHSSCLWWMIVQRNRG